MSFSLGTGRNNQLAAFLGENLEPATRTLDLVRLVFHMCNFTNLTLGFIAVGVSIGYDLSKINVEGVDVSQDNISVVETKFLVIGCLTLIHGLIGAYGFVSRQSRSLIVYGCLGLCLLIAGGIFSWEAHLRDEDVAKTSRTTFYKGWSGFVTRFEWSLAGLSTADQPIKKSKEDNDPVSEDELFIWSLLVNRTCQMQFVPAYVENDTESSGYLEDLDTLEALGEFKCKKAVAKVEPHCDFNMCNGYCDEYGAFQNLNFSYDATNCAYRCVQNYDLTNCLKYVRENTMLRILAMYLVLFLLSFTQSVCFICDILFIFWSLKEEADIECHKKAELENKRYSTKLTLLARFLPCCFRIPDPNSNNSSIRQQIPGGGGLPLHSIQSESEGSMGERHAVTNSGGSLAV